VAELFKARPNRMEVTAWAAETIGNEMRLAAKAGGTHPFKHLAGASADRDRFDCRDSHQPKSCEDTTEPPRL
jgi:hypothetical protein